MHSHEPSSYKFTFKLCENVERTLYKVPLIELFDRFLDSGAEICQIFYWFFGKFKDIKKTFWNYLTFTDPPAFSDLPTALADGHHSLGEAGNLVSQLTLSQAERADYAHLITTGPPEFSDLPTALSDGHHSLGGEAGSLVSQDRQQQHHHSYVGVLQRPRERFQSSVHGGQNLGITKSFEDAAEHEVFVTLMRAEHLGSFWRDFLSGQYFPTNFLVQYC